SPERPPHPAPAVRHDDRRERLSLGLVEGEALRRQAASFGVNRGLAEGNVVGRFVGRSCGLGPGIGHANQKSESDPPEALAFHVTPRPRGQFRLISFHPATNELTPILAPIAQATDSPAATPPTPGLAVRHRAGSPPTLARKSRTSVPRPRIRPIRRHKW